jgi:hypothetical protein
VILRDGVDKQIGSIGDSHNAMAGVSYNVTGGAWSGSGVERTVGKYPRVKTLSRLVFPHAPSPMMTSFLKGINVSLPEIGCEGGATAEQSGRVEVGHGRAAYRRTTFWVPALAMANVRRTGTASPTLPGNAFGSWARREFLSQGTWDRGSGCRWDGRPPFFGRG